jgi:hypothetical protein
VDWEDVDVVDRLECAYSGEGSGRWARNGTEEVAPVLALALALALVVVVAVWMGDGG